MIPKGLGKRVRLVIVERRVALPFPETLIFENFGGGTIVQTSFNHIPPVRLGWMRTEHVPALIDAQEDTNPVGGVGQVVPDTNVAKVPRNNKQANKQEEAIGQNRSDGEQAATRRDAPPDVNGQSSVVKVVRSVNVTIREVVRGKVLKKVDQLVSQNTQFLLGGKSAKQPGEPPKER